MKHTPQLSPAGRAHGPECETCDYQERINAAVAGRPYVIEYDFFKDEGDIIPIESYTMKFTDRKGMLINAPIMAPIEIKSYRRGDPINLLNFLTDKGLELLREDADRLYAHYAEEQR